MGTNPEEKKPLDAPSEKECEKKDAGAQMICGYSWAGGCSQLVKMNKL